MNPGSFDPDNWPVESYPWWLQWFRRVWAYASPRVTGHTAHALNALLVWVLIGGPLWLPLAWYWPFAVAFYTLRELPDLFRGRGDSLDHWGDMVYVYAMGIALWCPPVALAAWMAAVVVPVQVAYWCRPAPGWMPREALLWGRR